MHLKSPEQVKNVLANIDQANMRVIPADSAEGASIARDLGIAKKADVMDMEGNKIPDGAKIMGGKEVPTSIDQESFLQRVNKAVQENRESDAAIKARLDADNKKGIASIKINLVDDSIAKIKSMEPIEAMKEANLVAGKKGRYANLDDNQVKKIMDDTQDHIFERDIPDEDFATGGRVGLKGGTFLNFLKKFKVKQSGDDVKEFLSKRKFMKDIVGNTEKAKKARELRMLKEAMEEARNNPGFKFPEITKEEIEKKIAPILLKDRKLNADGGRIGLKGGAFLNFIKNMTMNKKSPLQFGKDYLKNVKEKTLRANETGKFMDLPLAEVGIPATTGALVNNQIRKKLKAMNEDQKEENLKMFINQLENDEFYDKYPDLKDKMISDYTESLFGEKKADGGRIGYFMGSAYPKGAAALREMLKLFGKKSDSVKNPSDILKIVNPKQFNKMLEDPRIYGKFDVEKGIGAPDMIKNLQKKMTSDRQSTVKEMLDAAKNIKTADNNTIRYKNKMIEDMMNKGVDRKMAEEMAETISRMAEDATGKFNTPKLSDEGILQLENILKNMETGGKKARDLNANGGRIGLQGGGSDASKSDFKTSTSQSTNREKGIMSRGQGPKGTTGNINNNNNNNNNDGPKGPPSSN
jgi:ribosomal 50S subunit-recycling heat shock protein